ncbi:cysteine--tRNA ligase [Candidatus Micrarchaeota archaeon RBG_16_49_10]|nr:MAG: cysteine--tRNA ligase [Candidatus Micrarchaeota archaeon RBG_16_49_10]
MKLLNTQSGKKELFKPRNGRNVKFFVCGPTVYDYSHIGHAKTYIQFDMIAKYMRAIGYDVFYLQNITDLDDKIIQRAKERKIDPKQLAEEFEAEYYKDLKTLGVNSITKFARATDFIKEMINQVKILMERGYTYENEDGVYFDLSKFPEYGKLSGRTALEAEDAVTRIDESVKKRNKGDFCLWKLSKPGEPKWPSPFGEGRPGWHIEDTAITETVFGPQYDVHGGARDLIFPHHEAEIAQMEAASGKKPFVKYWLHTGFLTINGQKMSKSLGNFITIRDALKKWNAKTLRYFFISTHYRSPIDFSEENLVKAQNTLDRLNEFMEKTESGIDNFDDKLIETTRNDFLAAMNDDLDTPRAFAVIFNFIREVNKTGGGKKAHNLLRELDAAFNILSAIEKKEIPKEIEELVKERQLARERKDWKRADEIRKKINEMGYAVEDEEGGARIRTI